MNSVLVVYAMIILDVLFVTQYTYEFLILINLIRWRPKSKALVEQPFVKCRATGTTVCSCHGRRGRRKRCLCRLICSERKCAHFTCKRRTSRTKSGSVFDTLLPKGISSRLRKRKKSYEYFIINFLVNSNHLVIFSFFFFFNDYLS